MSNSISEEVKQFLSDIGKIPANDRNLFNADYINKCELMYSKLNSNIMISKGERDVNISLINIRSIYSFFEDLIIGLSGEIRDVYIKTYQERKTEIDNLNTNDHENTKFIKFHKLIAFIITLYVKTKPPLFNFKYKVLEIQIPQIPSGLQIKSPPLTPLYRSNSIDNDSLPSTPRGGLMIRTNSRPSSRMERPESRNSLVLDCTNQATKKYFIFTIFNEKGTKQTILKKITNQENDEENDKLKRILDNTTDFKVCNLHSKEDLNYEYVSNNYCHGYICEFSKNNIVVFDRCFLSNQEMFNQNEINYINKYIIDKVNNGINTMNTSLDELLKIKSTVLKVENDLDILTVKLSKLKTNNTFLDIVKNTNVYLTLLNEFKDSSLSLHNYKLVSSIYKSKFKILNDFNEIKYYIIVKSKIWDNENKVNEPYREIRIELTSDRFIKNNILSKLSIKNIKNIKFRTFNKNILINYNNVSETLASNNDFGKNSVLLCDVVIEFKNQSYLSYMYELGKSLVNPYFHDDHKFIIDVAKLTLTKEYKNLNTYTFDEKICLTNNVVFNILFSLFNVKYNQFKDYSDLVNSVTNSEDKLYNLLVTDDEEKVYLHIGKKSLIKFLNQVINNDDNKRYHHYNFTGIPIIESNSLFFNRFFFDEVILDFNSLRFYIILKYYNSLIIDIDNFNFNYMDTIDESTLKTCGIFSNDSKIVSLKDNLNKLDNLCIYLNNKYIDKYYNMIYNNIFNTITPNQQNITKINDTVNYLINLYNSNKTKIDIIEQSYEKKDNLYNNILLFNLSNNFDKEISSILPDCVFESNKYINELNKIKKYIIQIRECVILYSNDENIFRNYLYSEYYFEYNQSDQEICLIKSFLSNRNINFDQSSEDYQKLMGYIEYNNLTDLYINFSTSIKDFIRTVKSITENCIEEYMEDLKYTSSKILTLKNGTLIVQDYKPFSISRDLFDLIDDSKYRLWETSERSISLERIKSILDHIIYVGNYNTKFIDYYIKSTLTRDDLKEFIKRRPEITTSDEKSSYEKCKKEIVEICNLIVNIKNHEKSINDEMKTEIYTKDYKKIINDQSDSITNLYIENSCIIRLIYSKYSNIKIKESYRSSNSLKDLLKNALNNIKSKIDSITQFYRGIDDINNLITYHISGFNDDIYELRNIIYKNIDTSLLKEYPSIINEINKLSEIDNTKELEKYGITNLKNIFSTISSITSNFSIENKYIVYKKAFASKLREMINDLVKHKSHNIMSKIFEFQIPELMINKDNINVKKYGYDNSLFKGLKDFKVDKYTLDKFMSYFNLIKNFIDHFSSILMLINSGPGMHILSDCIEEIIKLKTGEKQDTTLLVELIKKFFSYHSYDSIVKSDNFIYFVYIINGTFKVDEIQYFNELEGSFYQIEPDVSVDFVRNLFECMNNINMNFNYSFDILNTNLLYKMNSCVIRYIDEFYDKNELVVTDINYLELKSLNVKFITSGKIFKPLFNKLNACMIKFLEERLYNVHKLINDKFFFYIRVFLNTMDNNTILDNYILNK